MTNTSLNLFTYGEKVYKDPSGRWLFIQSGEHISKNDVRSELLKEVDSALMEFYNRKSKNPLFSLADAVRPDIKDANFWKKAVIVTKTDAWFQDVSVPVSPDTFSACGAGMYVACGFYAAFRDAKKAMEAASKWNSSSGGPVHEYHQSNLKPFPTFL